MSAPAIITNRRLDALAHELLTATLDYAGKGYPVFPCKPVNKRPYLRRDHDENGQPIPKTGGLYKATTDQGQLRTWWTTWPLAMIGLPTGKRSGLIVLDIDCKDGVDGFAALPNWRQLSPVAVRTPSGGVHLFFQADSPLRNSAGKLAPGLDIRADGGYAILPPSRPMMDGPDYGWEDGYESL